MSRLRTLVALALIAATIDLSQAQTVVLQVDPAVDTFELRTGPNRKFYTHSFLALGFLAGQKDPAAPVLYGRAIDIRFGVLHKIKWTNFFSNCIEMALHNTELPFNGTEPMKSFPDTVMNKKEKLRSFGIQLNLLQRFNIGHRGDKLGNFIDLGAGVDWVPWMDHLVRNDIADGTKQKVVTRKLPYRQAIYYSAIGKVGLGGINFFGHYRLTPMIKSGFGDPVLPVWTFGVGIKI